MYNGIYEDVSVESFLGAGENVLWKSTPQKNAYIAASVVKMLPIAIIWALFDGVFIAVMIASGAFSVQPQLVWFVVPFFLVHLAPVWIWIAGIVKAVKEHKNIEYVLTENRLIVKSGVAGTDFKAIYYKEISSISISANFSDRLLHVGDITVRSRLNTVIICDQDRPSNVAKLIQERIDEAAEKESNSEKRYGTEPYARDNF